MDLAETLPEWKPALDAIVGARHGDRSAGVLEQLRDLDARHPNVAEIAYQLAWTCDVLGREREALPYYEKAVALGLPRSELGGALLGLGSTLRCLGQYERAAEVLRSAKTELPESREFDVFLAMTLHNLGRHAEAMELLLATLADTSKDPGITAYQRAIRFYADKLEQRFE
jgi:tetratricopeptide (TPR) repeat protein